MSARIFVDSNVLVYARDGGEVEKQPVAAAWLEAIWRSRRGRVSMQVLQEFYVTTTVKLKPGLPVADARREVEELSAWDPVVADTELLRSAWLVQDRYGLSFWDSLVVAAAQQAGCDVLLTEDLQDGQDLDGVRVVNPFRHSPAEFDLVPAAG
jgi:predicted nucleic acid-binding protein